MTRRPEALVTGASSGIGAATCARLRQDGWHVAGLARRPSPEADASLCADLTHFDEVLEAVGSVTRLRLLVHAGAMIGPITPLCDGDPDAWRRTVEVNLLGTYNLLRAALAGTLGRDGGIAIHLTTGAASNPKPFWSAYSASKAGAEHLIRSAASEVEGSACGICSLDPGATDTPMQDAVRTHDFPDLKRFIHLHEQGSLRAPDDVAAAICELSRREPSTLNGQTFLVGNL